MTMRAEVRQEADEGRAEAQGEPTAWAQGLRQAVARGEHHWFSALLDVIAAWQRPEEIVGSRRYRYLIDGEAFDWLLLAERLCLELDGLVPEEEMEALLFEGHPPVPISEEEFRRIIGPAKYRAHLNFFYGVLVEEALQLAVEEEVQKERLSHVWTQGQQIDDEACQRIYGLTRRELFQKCCQERGLELTDGLSLDEYKGFTYWLFKYRLRCCDPARVASDTRKGLAMLAGLESARQRRLARQAAPQGWTL